MSTAIPSVMLGNYSIKKPNKVIVNIANIHEEENSAILQYFIDDHNHNFYIVPLNEVLCRNYDRKFIAHLSTYKLLQNHGKFEL